MHQFFLFFFFNDTATTEIYTLSLHDALPISNLIGNGVATMLIARWEGELDVVTAQHVLSGGAAPFVPPPSASQDRKSTRLNSSHSQISYAVFCLKKKKNKYQHASLLNLADIT